MEADMIDAGGVLWFTITVVGAIILALGILLSSQRAKHAPRDAETLRRKREATRANFSDEAVEEKPIFGETEPIPEVAPQKKQRPRVARKAGMRRPERQPDDHTVS
jgi:hypothetical protein